MNSVIREEKKASSCSAAEKRDRERAYEWSMKVMHCASNSASVCPRFSLIPDAQLCLECAISGQVSVSLFLS